MITNILMEKNTIITWIEYENLKNIFWEKKLNPQYLRLEFWLFNIIKVTIFSSFFCNHFLCFGNNFLHFSFFNFFLSNLDALIQVEMISGVLSCLLCCFYTHRKDNHIQIILVNVQLISVERLCHKNYILNIEFLVDMKSCHP